MGGYYEERLSGQRLVDCYALASARIRQYLDSEICFVIEKVRGSARVLELGCGYGRVLKQVAPSVGTLIGNDISQTSLALARTYLAECPNCGVLRMDASEMAFRSGTFDAVFCIQNGISAFGVDRRELAREAARVTRNGGQILFSSYAPDIWEARLDWFRAQARAGLLGPIDEAETGNGTIVCEDGFRVGTVDAGEFETLFAGLGRSVATREIDGSSLFCLVLK